MQGTLGNVVFLYPGRGNDIDEHLASFYYVYIISVNFLENPIDLVPLLPLFICEEPEVQRGYPIYSGTWWSQDSGIGMCDSKVHALPGTLNTVQAHMNSLTSRVFS